MVGENRRAGGGASREGRIGLAERRRWLQKQPQMLIEATPGRLCYSSTLGCVHWLGRMMAARGRQYLIATLAVLSSVAHAEPLGFHSENASDLPTNCAVVALSESLRMSLDELVADAGLSSVALSFRRCDWRGFQASPLEIPGQPTQYFIDLPSPGFYPEDTETAAVAHELYHIAQFVRFGSRLDVVLHYGSVRAVELSADFAAGFLLSELTSVIYETSAVLRGDFLTEVHNHHGLPHERASAYRYGRFFTTTQSRALSLSRADDYFTTFLLPDI